VELANGEPYTGPIWGKKGCTLTPIKTGSELSLVAHACNPSYLGVRDQEDQGSKPAQANSP
jgi:hypothetical protein